MTAAMIGFGKSRVTMPAKPPLPRAMSMPRPCATTLRSAPGREHLAGAGEHDGAECVVGLDLVEDAGHRLADLGADRVARVGPVEREERDVSAPFEFYECHAAGTLTLGRRSSIAAVMPGRTSRVIASTASMSTAAPIVVARSPMWSAILPCTIAPSG